MIQHSAITQAQGRSRPDRRAQTWRSYVRGELLARFWIPWGILRGICRCHDGEWRLAGSEDDARDSGLGNTSANGFCRLSSRAKAQRGSLKIIKNSLTFSNGFLSFAVYLHPLLHLACRKYIWLYPLGFDPSVLALCVYALCYVTHMFLND